MTALTAGLSGAVAAVALLLALLLWRVRPRDGAAVWLLPLLPVLAALELATGPVGGDLPPVIRRALAFIGTANLALIWLCMQALLIDGFRPRPWHWAVALLLWSGPLLVFFGQTTGLAGGFAALLPFLMLAHLGWLALSGRADDLVAGRRRARLIAPALLLVAALVSLLSEQIGDPQLADLVRAGLAGPLAMLVLALWLLRIDPGALVFTPTPQTTPPAPAIDPRDRDLAMRLAAAMDSERLWQREGLTLDALAAHLATPSHRLRALINTGLGHRNFLAYVNGYRLAAACAALADPARGRETVLAIAYESGFASLATFNRVFRDTLGQTPTAYREAALAEPAAALKD